VRAGIILRAQRAAGVLPRPLKRNVRSLQLDSSLVKTLRSFLLTVVIFLAVAVFYSRLQHHTAHPVSSTPQFRQNDLDSRADTSEAPPSLFHCDGRTYCAQMTSCDEAKYFLAHCPNVRIDGDNDRQAAAAQPDR
jgi:hypothetical protein